VRHVQTTLIFLFCYAYHAGDVQARLDLALWIVDRLYDEFAVSDTVAAALFDAVATAWKQRLLQHTSLERLIRTRLCTDHVELAVNFLVNDAPLLPSATVNDTQLQQQQQQLQLVDVSAQCRTDGLWSQQQRSEVTHMRYNSSSYATNNVLYKRCFASAHDRTTTIASTATATAEIEEQQLLLSAQTHTVALVLPTKAYTAMLPTYQLELLHQISMLMKNSTQVFNSEVVGAVLDVHWQLYAHKRTLYIAKASAVFAAAYLSVLALAAHFVECDTLGTLSESGFVCGVWQVLSPVPLVLVLLTAVFGGSNVTLDSNSGKAIAREITVQKTTAQVRYKLELVFMGGVLGCNLDQYWSAASIKDTRHNYCYCCYYY
jgi:hypothetical protein